MAPGDPFFADFDRLEPGVARVAPPMRYHLVLNRNVDLDQLMRDAAGRQCPRPVMGMLRDRLAARVHMPSPGPARLDDKVRSLLFGSPDIWAMARTIAGQVSEGEVIFCNGEDTGLPIAVACAARGVRPRLAVFAHNLDRPRARAALKLYRIADKVDLFITNIDIQVDFLRQYLGLDGSRVKLIQDQTDREFFTPGPPASGKVRPMIASVGLEQRDYRTLAEATQDLDVDVRISGFSSDAAIQSRAFPDVLPANMTRRFYAWPDLAQLYRDADLIVVSLYECKYSAGITTVMEGLASRRPLVVTRTAGISYFLDSEAMRITSPGDAQGLRREIVALLAAPGEASSLAERGYELGRRHDSDQFTEQIAGWLASL